MKVSNSENEGRDYVNELQVHVEECSFKWELAGFNEVPFLTEHPVFSPSFILGASSDSVWQMLMSKEFRCKKNGKSSKSEKSTDTEVKTEPESREGEADLKSTKIEADPEPKEMEVDLKSESEAKSEERTLGFKLIKTEEGSTWDVIKYRIEFTAGNVKKTTREKTETGSPYCSTTEFMYMYESDLEGLDLDNVKTVHMEAFIEYTYIDLHPLELSGLEEVDQFTEDLCRLFKTQKFSDVILRVGDLEIPAHKGILCARAYGFDCHLQEDSEFVKQKLVLDMDECVAKAMLAFIYCGGLPIEFPLEKCKALCTAANKYQVSGLKSLATEFFKNNLDPEVCPQCFKLGDSDSLDSIDLSDEELKSLLQKKTCSHKSEQQE